MLAGILAGACPVAAYPVAYSVTGTFGAASGPDPLKLSGKGFSISATIDTQASCCPYTTGVTIQAGSLPAVSASAQIGLSAGNPGSISVAATVSVLGVSIPFSAQASVQLTSSTPYPFAAESITAGTVTYGTSSNPTTLSIASGTISASGTPPPLTASSNALTFNYQVSGSAPASQTDTITATGANFSIAASTSSGGNWLSVAPTTGTNSAVLTVSVNPAGLSAGTYSGSINVTSTQTANNLSISVTLNVTQVTVAYTPSPPSFSFAYQVGGSPPGSQNLTISTSPSANIGFSLSSSTASGGNWLSVTPASGTTPGSVSVSVNPAGLSPNTYDGSIVITGLGTNSPLTIPVTLTVTALLSANPGSIAFAYQTGESTPPSQTVRVSAAGSAAVSFQTAASGGQWLSVAPSAGTTPSELTISVNPTGLAAGTYTGAITVTSAFANTVSIPVTLAVATQPLLSVLPGTLTFGYELGGSAPTAQTLSVSVTGSSPLNYTVSQSGGSWLKVSPASGVTPSSLNVAINPAGLAVNTYSATITITAAGASNSPVNVPVVLQVVAQTTITVAPSQLQFVVQNGGSAPASQSITVTSDPVGVTVDLSTSGGSWLSLGSSSIVAPASVPVSINPTGLKIGTYTGAVSATGSGAANNPQTVAVSLLITGPTSLTATPALLNFSVPAGAPAPAPQSVSIGSTSGSQSFTVTSAATWLSGSPASNVAPANLLVSINSAGLAPGGYSGVLILTPSNLSNGALTIPVNLIVTAPVPTITAISNAASYLQYSFARGLAPGCFISILGTTLGPETPLSTQLTANGLVSTALGNTSVLINNQPSPLLYVSPTQVNAIVPFATTEVATIKVVYNGVSSNIFTIPVAPASPGLFTTNENGKGQGAILNEDGSVNSSANPAAKGSIVVLYGDGAGQTTPAGLDGAITSIVAPELPQPLLPVAVQIGGENAQVTYAGAAVGFVSGMLQVNVQIPQDVPSGNAAVVLMVGNASSQPGVTVAIQ